jgi:hypothetical protein
MLTRSFAPVSMRLSTPVLLLAALLALPASAQDLPTPDESSEIARPARDGARRRPSAPRVAPAALVGAGGLFTDISTSLDGPSINGTVVAVAPGPDGTFTVGGSFSSAGGRPAASVARWDGAEWQPLGSGIGFGIVRELVTGPGESLYAGGSFKRVGDAVIHGVVRWDGAAWRSVSGAAVDTLVQNVEALAVGPDGSLYAGGNFLTAAGTRVTGVGRWTGTAWQILGEGGPLTGRAIALAVGADGTVYAGGPLRLNGAVVNVARWNGATWTALGQGTSVGSVRSLLISLDGALVAGGSITQISGVAANGIARWDGAAWSPIGGGVDGYVNALATLPDGRLVAGGDFQTAGGVAAQGLAAWDGAAWQAVGESMDGRVAAVAVGPDGRLAVVGDFSLAGDTPADAVARWDGAAWEGFGNTTGQVGAAVSGPDGSVYVGGYLSTVAGVAVRGVARWDGAAWSALGDGPRASVYSAMALGPDGTLYIGTDRNRVLRWDGTAWSEVGPGLPTGLNELYSMTVGSDGLLYIGGRRYDDGEGIRRWNGAAWESVGAGLLGNVWSLAVGPDGQLYAGGEFIQTVSGAPPASVARWDGTAWTIIGAVTPGYEVPVNALAFTPNGDLYAGGYFEVMNGVPLRNLARWDGTAWFEVGGSTGVPGEVFTLLPTADGGLYVGGNFEALTRWDGMAWTSVGPFSPYDYVFGLARDRDGDLLIGGFFQSAGGVASPNVVLYTPAPVASEPAAGPAEALALSVAPNPARGAATATVTHAAGPVTVEILDALGRRVAHVAAEGAAETHTLALPVGRLAPGAYVVRAVAGGAAASRPLVVVR